jgi:hypothetical protein
MNKVYIVYLWSDYERPVLYSVHASEQGAKNAIENYIDQELAKGSYQATPEKVREWYDERFYWDEVDLLD